MIGDQPFSNNKVKYRHIIYIWLVYHALIICDQWNCDWLSFELWLAMHYIFWFIKVCYFFLYALYIICSFTAGAKMILSSIKFLKKSKISLKTLMLEVCSPKKWKGIACRHLPITVQHQNLYTNLPFVCCSANIPSNAKEIEKGGHKRRWSGEKSSSNSSQGKKHRYNVFARKTGLDDNALSDSDK